MRTIPERSDAEGILLSGRRGYRTGRNKLSAHEIDAQIHSLEAVSTEQNHVTRLGKYCNGW